MIYCKHTMFSLTFLNKSYTIPIIDENEMHHKMLNLFQTITLKVSFVECNKMITCCMIWGLLEFVFIPLVRLSMPKDWENA